MPPSDFATVDIDKVLNDLTTAEAILLTAGEGLWHTQSVDRLGIPAIKVCQCHSSYLDLFMIAGAFRLAMVRMVFEEVITLWAHLQIVCQ
jgi:hypothetical protein